MEIKAAVFDVDGTLVPHGACEPGAANAAALCALQKKGIPVVIASGRARYTAQSVLGDGVRPDYFAAANGSDVTDASGNVVWRSCMTLAELDALVSFCEEKGSPLEFIFPDAYYAYLGYQRYLRQYKSRDTSTKGITDFLRDGEARTRHLQDMPLAACTTLPRAHVEEFAHRHGALGLRFVSFAPDEYDVLRADVHKAVGVGHLLEHLGISWEQTAVFGDGDNDAEIFRRAGFRVAMGDGSAEIQALASVIAPAAGENGVARAIEEYLL